MPVLASLGAGCLFLLNQTTRVMCCWKFCDLIPWCFGVSHSLNDLEMAWIRVESF